MDPFSLTCWRKRIGKEGVETLLTGSIDAARRGGVSQKSSLRQAIVDATVMPKAIVHPTLARVVRTWLCPTRAVDAGCHRCVGCCCIRTPPTLSPITELFRADYRLNALRTSA